MLTASLLQPFQTAPADGSPSGGFAEQRLGIAFASPALATPISTSAAGSPVRKVVLKSASPEALVAASLHDEVGWIRLGARAIRGARSAAPVLSNR